MGTIENVGDAPKLAADSGCARGWPLGGRLVLALTLAVLTWALPVGVVLLLW
jgi:hypothetical protein